MTGIQYSRPCLRLVIVPFPLSKFFMSKNTTNTNQKIISKQILLRCFRVFRFQYSLVF